MGTIEDITQMKKSGKTDEEIAISLKNSGLSDDKIKESMIQAQIKSAVIGKETEGIKNSQNSKDIGEQKKMANEESENQQEQEEPVGAQYQGMQPSMMGQATEETSENYYPQGQDQYIPQAAQYQAPTAQQYDYSQGQYQPYQSGISSDTITEISEQIVDEKILSLKGQLEKVLDFRNTVESKIESIDERLKRIEKIIDRLQLSILQKVGDYITNIDDIKNEIIETQKSFKSLLPEAKSGLHTHEKK